MRNIIQFLTALSFVAVLPLTALQAQDAAAVQPIPGASAPSDLVSGAPATTTDNGTPLPKKPKITAEDRKKAMEVKKAARLAKRAERVKKREEAKRKREARMSKFNTQSSTSSNSNNSSGTSNPYSFGSPSGNSSSSNN